MDPIGKSPVPAPILIFGKVAMVSCWLFFIVKVQGADAMLYDSVVTEAIGVVVFVAGLALVVFSFVYLGQSVSICWKDQGSERCSPRWPRLSENCCGLEAIILPVT